LLSFTCGKCIRKSNEYQENCYVMAFIQANSDS
jgi:hypothetical protein